ncbi:MAG: adenine-specific methyltransferase EcoRI family protein [Kocuria sp.]|nr:adenine-specific methyltransferase EcoRI family protein [Kocuria sp.]
MANKDLGAAKTAKKDEFYTQWADIEREMNAYLEFDKDVFRDRVVLLPCDDPEWSNFAKFFALHFQEFGLKKLISTSFAPNSNPAIEEYEPTLFEVESPAYDPEKSKARGKKFVIDSTDVNGDGRVDIEDLRWQYLDGDGDFRSEEVTALREQSDIVITNPPFSLFRTFVDWLVAGDVKFSIIGNMNGVTYKNVFPLIRENKLWYGPSITSGDREFRVPESYPLTAAGSRVADDGSKYVRVKGVRWFTNIDHGRRHEPLPLLSEADNKLFNKRVGAAGYQRYENYDAIEVPTTNSIPADYQGLMGVPITFLDKYSPEQFEILGCADYTGLYGSDHLGIGRIGETWMQEYRKAGGRGHYTANMTSLVFYDQESIARPTFKRIVVRHLDPAPRKDA